MQQRRSTELVREAKEALARFDVARLGEILVESAGLADCEVISSDSRVSKDTEFEAFAALLEFTRENMTIIQRQRGSAGFHLEYQPFATRAQEGATY